MTDVLSKEQRSRNMSRIRSKNTGPERTVRTLLHLLGYRFRLHSAHLPGKPDIVLPKYKIAIFVHGCFWHRHKNCKYAYTPKTRVEFWQQKFEANVKRDRQVRKNIQSLGWKSAVIWECQTGNMEVLRKCLLKIMNV
jgi:DNA mismatch endonuclease, patch repair protein